MISILRNVLAKSFYRWKKAGPHVQIESGNLKKVRKLLQEDPSLANAVYHNSYTTLHVAAYEGHKDIVAELISNGANINAKTKHGATPLDVAEERGFHSIVYMLKQY